MAFWLRSVELSHGEVQLPPLTVCIVDTAVHPERLPAGAVAASVSFVTPGGQAFSTRPTHGEAVALTVLAAASFARLVLVELLDKDGRLMGAGRIDAAFTWIDENAESLGVAVVCAAFADMSHRRSDTPFRGSALQRSIAALRDRGVATVAPAGNWYARHRHTAPEGMAWPAILREIVGVGALDPDPWITGLDFHSQRLQRQPYTGCGVTVFARAGPPGESSGAAAVVAGRLAALRQTQPHASVDALVQALLADSHLVYDAEGQTWPALRD